MAKKSSGSGHRRYGLCDPEMRPLAITVFTCVFSTYCVAAVGAAFFPIVASSPEFGLTTVEIGAVFSSLPLMVGLTSPLASYLCNQWGKLPLVIIGLFLQAASALAFGYGSDTIWFIVCSAIDGIGAAFMEVASLGLLYANVVDRDLPSVVSWQEMLIGLGCVLGPPFGGLVYHFFGFTVVYMSAAALLGFMWIVVVLNWIFNCRKWNQFDIVYKPRIPKEPKKKNAGAAPQLPELSLSSWCCSFAVIFGAFAIAQSFCTIGAIDVIFASHLQATLSIDTSAIGALFAFQAFVYVLSSSFVTKISSDLSPKMTMFLGEILTGISFLLIGPLPYSDAFVDSSWMVWVLVVVGLIVGQLGLACGLIPAVPLIKGYIDREFTQLITASNAFQVLVDDDDDGNNQEADDDDEDSDEIDVRGEPFLELAEEEDTIEKKVSSNVSTIFNFSASVGQAIGPILAGFLMDALPKRQEVMCITNEDNPLSSPQCLSGFQWTASCFAGLAFLAAFFVLAFVPDLRQDDEENSQASADSPDK
eukprot:TRINITY_DN41871_c0_g1_i1.p1 TRINITY_DN41871_c0_g1~~TRINITY_DN41871_c0_g1_i1.p1  ORF type:complete len:544 (-),score=122.83 TRINITY_DN41871_c0_g1_i1:65-1657(-)